MSKKAKLYLLIVVNFIAWGYVGYKIYGALQGSDDAELSYEKTRFNKIDEVIKEDSITLNLNYADPFLKNGSFASTKIHPSTVENNTIQKKANSNNYIDKTPTSIAIPLLEIKYLGLIKNSDRGTQTAMITINGKSFFVKPKDLLEGLLIQEITSDFVKIKKGKELMIISK